VRLVLESTSAVMLWAAVTDASTRTDLRLVLSGAAGGWVLAHQIRRLRASRAVRENVTLRDEAERPHVLELPTEHGTLTFTDPRSLAERLPSRVEAERLDSELGRILSEGWPAAAVVAALKPKPSPAPPPPPNDAVEISRRRPDGGGS
jgi:hypothetical protein